MKTFNDDKPIYRYLFLFTGALIGSFTGAITATILIGVLLKR